MNIRDLVRGNNIIWYLLYYNELINYKNYQLSYFANADEDYYNCAHAVSILSEDELYLIEKFYIKRNLMPSFYTDPISEEWLIPKLIAHGYREVSQQEENWWVINITNKLVEVLQERVFLKIDPSLININLVCDDERLSAFVKVDQEANLLSERVTNSLKKNMLSKNCKEFNDAKNYFLLGTVNQLPAFCGHVGVYGDVAYFAEDGTLKNYRKCGLHLLMTQKRILFSFSKGAKLACITCTTEAYTNKTAKKLGFSLAFSRKLYKKY